MKNHRNIFTLENKHYALVKQKDGRIFYNTNVYTVEGSGKCELLDFPVNWSENKCASEVDLLESEVLKMIEKVRRRIHQIQDKVFIQPPLGLGATAKWIEVEHLEEMENRGWYC